MARLKLRADIRKRHKRSRGQALVEFALILPILLLVVAGIFDFGRALFTYSEVSNAVREATRYAATLDFKGTNADDCAGIISHARSMFSLGTSSPVNVSVVIESPDQTSGHFDVKGNCGSVKAVTGDRINISVSTSVELTTLSMIAPLIGGPANTHLPISYNSARSVVPPEGIATGPTTTAQNTITAVASNTPTPELPGVPGIFAVTWTCNNNNNNNNVDATWTASSGVVTGYRIYKLVGPNPTLVWQGSSVGASNFDPTFTANTSTTYYVVAYNSNGESGQSNPGTATCGAVNTNTPMPTATNTQTPTPTGTSTNTPTPTSTSTSTPTPTPTPTISANTLCYPLTVVITPTVGGSVNLNPIGMCPGTNRYLPGTVVTLTESAGSNYNFGAWSGAVTTTTNPIAITMNTTKTVTATFTLQPPLQIVWYAGYPTYKPTGTLNMFLKVVVTSNGVPVNNATVIILNTFAYAGFPLFNIPGSAGVYGDPSNNGNCWVRTTSTATFVMIQASLLGYQSATVSGLTVAQSGNSCP